ncbi:MAG: protein-(glutamine-N5) methyltransferase, release factor-specific [Candidatus Marinimicrobia bacterium]|nr:protein-(glutamine-N5) methyltransferase, release factor-specific [Candidatus Neomarinimicrobiota bacterium]
MVTVPQDGQITNWLNWSAAELVHSLEDNKQEAEWLLSSLLNCSKSELYLQKNELSEKKCELFQDWISRRIKGEPAQYIAGWTEFYGHRFNVNKSVLIPRAETERLVDVAIYTLQELEKHQIVDIGTGSGCIAISVAAEIPSASVLGLDISPEALVTAEENASINKLLNVQFLQTDFLQFTPSEPVYDGLLMNPPYIPTNEMDTLMKEVRDYEPDLALTDYEDGLTFYRHLADTAQKWVRPGGWLILEVGLGEHPQKAITCFDTKGFAQLELIADFNTDDRILKVQVV